MKPFLAIVTCVCLTIPLLAHNGTNKEKEDDRLKQSYDVLKEILGISDNGIPKDLLNKADCVVIFPSVKKGAFIVGASYGRGVMVCRTGEDYRGSWSAPAMYALEGASVGFQIGGEATDFVLLVMNEKGANSVMSSKVKLGADASAAAGPVGRNASAETDIALKADILSYSRAKGLFGGVSLEGSSLRPDDGANKDLYKEELSVKDIVRENKVKIPDAGKALISLLQDISPKRVS
jgi:SH3 domain-containing YSC84-like protein 1